MGTPTSPAAYGREREIWLQALESERGIAVDFPDETSAKQFRQRLYSARKREQLTAAVRNAEPGTSDFDHLQITLEPSGEAWSVLIRPLIPTDLNIREL